MKEQEYPGIPERIKALFVDSILLIIAMMVITDVFAQFEQIPNYIRITAFVFIFLLYDPLCTSILGGTAGHLVMGLRVKRVDQIKKNILLHKAVLRYLTKAFLGWISLLTVNSNEKRQAIHDYLIGSVVLYKEG